MKKGDLRVSRDLVVKLVVEEVLREDLKGSVNSIAETGDLKFLFTEIVVGTKERDRMKEKRESRSLQNLSHSTRVPRWSSVNPQVIYD